MADPSVVDSLELEEIEANLFRCTPSILWRPHNARGVFGGQIIGLALAAASRTVDSAAFRAHSLHSYFLLAGDHTHPIVFHVTRVRDARSFATRQVTAVQRGAAIFAMLCSFMAGEERALVHQYAMPHAPPPEALPSREAMLSEWMTRMPSERHRSMLRGYLQEPIPIDMRPCDPRSPQDHVFPDRKPPHQLVWMRSKAPLPADRALHMCVAAYCSDHHLAWTVVRPHAVTPWTNPALKMLVSLDHSIWFHTDFRADDWLLYEMESPRTSGNRGVALGRLWTRDGRLVATCAQEALVRVVLKPNRPLSVPAIEPMWVGAGRDAAVHVDAPFAGAEPPEIAPEEAAAAGDDPGVAESVLPGACRASGPAPKVSKL